MDNCKYRYYLLNHCWLARLEKGRSGLEDKEFYLNGEWRFDKELNLELNDCMMDYGDSSVLDFDEISEEEAQKIIALPNNTL